MAASFAMAFALMLVIEGIVPLVAPSAWRETFRRITEFSDGQIRFFGLSSMLSGFVIFLLSR